MQAHRRKQLTLKSGTEIAHVGKPVPLQNTVSGCSTGTISRSTSILALSLRTPTKSTVSVSSSFSILMRIIWCEVYEIAGPHYRCEIEPFSPTYLAAALHYIERDLMPSIVMRPSIRIRFQGNGAEPGSLAPSTGEFKSGRASGSARSKHC